MNKKTKKKPVSTNPDVRKIIGSHSSSGYSKPWPEKKTQHNNNELQQFLMRPI